MEEIEQLQQRIQELELELASIRQAIPNIAYALRVPLVPIMGCARVLLEEEEKQEYSLEDRRECYTIIEENGSRLYRLNKDLLFSSPIMMGTSGVYVDCQEDVDIRKICESAIHSQSTHTDIHRILLAMDPQQIAIEADPSIIENVLYNLMHNAIKYSPLRGDIKINARLEEPTEEYPAGSLLMQIVDNGIGIDKPLLASLNQMLAGNTFASQAVRSMQGLYATGCLVERHHGALWLESEGKDKGTTANIRIPIKQSTNENA